MILTSTLFFGIALLPLTVVMATHGFLSLSIGTAVLWLLSLPMLRARDVRLAHLYVAAGVGLVTFVTFSGVPFPLTLLSMTALFAGWDAALATAHFSGPTSVAAGAEVRHTVWGTVYLAGSAALVLLIRLATIPLGFGSGLFLGLGGIMLAMLILRQLRKGTPSTPSSSNATEPQTTEPTGPTDST